MKLPNFLIHTFAAVGVISLIFWGCAAADSDNIDNPPQLTEEYGKYQVAVSTSLGMVILNTETGVLKSAFWHLFTMTAHSPVGLAPENYKVKKVKFFM